MNPEETTVSPDETTTTTEPAASEPQIVVPVEIRELTRVETEKGNIHVIHEFTFGDLMVSTSLFMLLIFLVLSRVIGGSKNV